MDLGGVDVWGQIALETSQMYVSEGDAAKSRTVSLYVSNIYKRNVICNTYNFYHILFH